MATPAQGPADALKRAGDAQPPRHVGKAVVNQDGGDLIQSPDVTRSTVRLPQHGVVSGGLVGRRLAIPEEYSDARQHLFVDAAQRVASAAIASDFSSLSRRAAPGAGESAKGGHSVVFDLHQQLDGGKDNE